MKLTKFEEEVQKALGTLSLYSVKVPRMLSPDDGLVYHLFIDACDEDDAREKICEVRPELTLYKETLKIRKCYKKDSGEIVWES
jgi:hypothetical protein